MEARQNIEEKSITAEQFALLTKQKLGLEQQLKVEKESLEFLSRTMKQEKQSFVEEMQNEKQDRARREEELIGLCQRNMAGFMHHSKENEASQKSLKESQEQLKKQQEQLQMQAAELKQAQLDKQKAQQDYKDQALEVKKTTETAFQRLKANNTRLQQECGSLHTKIATLSEESQGFAEELDNAQHEAAKTPFSKYLLNIALFVAGGLLTAAGVALIIAGGPLAPLGIAAFAVGTSLLAGEFLYGMYNAVKACFSSKDHSIPTEKSRLLPENDHEGPKHVSRRASVPGYSSLSSSPTGDVPRVSRSHSASNPYSFHNQQRASLSLDTGIGIGDLGESLTRRNPGKRG